MSYSLDDLLGKVREGGFDGLMEQGGIAAGQSSPRDELRKDFVRVFGTDAGRRVLDHLVKATILKTTWWPGGLEADGNPASFPNLEQVQAYGLMREGQNCIVAYMAHEYECGLELNKQVASED